MNKSGSHTVSKKLPMSSNLNEYMHLLNQLSDINAAHFLGLPANIGSWLQQRDAKNVITKLRAMTASNLTSRELSKDQVFSHLSDIFQLSQTSIHDLLLNLEKTLIEKIRHIPTGPTPPPRSDPHAHRA